MSGLTFLDYSMKIHSRGGHEVTFQVSRQASTAGVQYNAWQSDEGRYIIQKRDLSDTTDIATTYYYGKTKTQFATDWTGRAGLTYREYYSMFDNIV